MPIIAGYPAVESRITLPSGDVAIYTVDDLERLVDRGALLRGETDPPYWAYLWAGARCLAEYVVRWVDVRGLRVLEIGCGLGLPGLAAARAGAEVLFADAAAPALAFVQASAQLNDVRCQTWCGDLRTFDPHRSFDVILAAEVAYEPAGFEWIANLFARNLVPGGIGLLADGFRTDTRPLYRELVARRLTTRAIEFQPKEEGNQIRMRLTAISSE